MASEKTTAIVLRVTEFSETSCIAQVLTREFGKQTLIAKGARRPKSPFEAALDVLSVCRIVFIQKTSNSQGSAMGILTEAKLEQRFRNSSRDMNRLYAAYYVIELLKCLTEEGDPHPELFDLAVETIRTLNGSSFTQAKFAPMDQELEKDQNFFELNRCLLRFEVGLLKNLGHFPMLSRCVGCGKEKKTTNDAGFALNAGGIICPNCRSLQTNVIQVESRTIAILKQLGDQLEEYFRDKPGKLDGSNENQDSSEPLEMDDLMIGSAIAETEEEYTVVQDDVMAQAAVRKLVNRYMASVLGFEPRMGAFLQGLGRYQTTSKSAKSTP